MWAATWQKQQSECAHSEDSDQPGHPPSLIRVFAVRMKEAWVLSYPLSAQRRLWSDWVDVQADLSLRWTHRHFVGFVMSRLIFKLEAHGPQWLTWVNSYIEAIWVFQCKIEFYFTEWTPQTVFSRVAVATGENTDCGVHTPQVVFSRVAVATGENTDCGVHEWNKLQSYTEKSNFLFLYAFICNNYVFTYTSTLASEC